MRKTLCGSFRLPGDMRIYELEHIGNHYFFGILVWFPIRKSERVEDHL